MKSKAINFSKKFMKQERNVVVQFILMNIVYPIESLYNRYSERIRRSAAFACIGWLNYDFDAATIWPLLSFKLKRVHRTLLKGMAVQEKEDMDALLEAIQICDRLYKENYDRKYFKQHDLKYGKIVMKRTPDDESGFTRLTTSRKKVNKRNEEQERKDFLACFENAEKDRQKDLNRLNQILIKNAPTWWD